MVNNVPMVVMGVHMGNVGYGLQFVCFLFVINKLEEG